MLLGKVRAFVQKIDVDSKYRNVEVLYMETFELGFISDFKKDQGYHSWMDACLQEGDLIQETFQNSEFYDNASMKDIFEIIGDYDGYGSYSWEGDYDYEEELKNVKIRKLEEHQKLEMSDYFFGKTKLLDSLDD